MLNKTIKKAKLYSPTVNKKFKKYSIRKKDYLKDCNLSRSIQKFRVPKIEINNRCEFVNTQKAKHLLKKNLYSKKLNSIHKIITPKQLNSNCWFNTFFVNFFISDRGRQFTKYLRNAMIEGKRLNKKEFSTSEKKILSYLNLAIDACLAGNKIMYNFDTNKIIYLLFKLFKHKYREEFVNVGEAGNPIECYEDIINNIEGNKYSPFLFDLCPKHLYNSDTIYWNLNSRTKPYEAYKSNNYIDNLPKYWIKRTSPKIMNSWNNKQVLDWLNSFKYQISQQRLEHLKKIFKQQNIKGKDLNALNIDIPHNEMKILRHEINSNIKYDKFYKKKSYYFYNIKTKSTELFLSELLLPKPNSWNASFSGNNIPTLIVVELHNGKGFDDDSLEEKNYSNIIHKPESIKLITRDKKKIKYNLDSVIIRDTSNIHFCSVLTYGNKLYKFDGASFSTIKPFNWKQYINKNKEWGFNDKSLRWNFKDGSQILFYYRS